jgi:hypothetical protein
MADLVLESCRPSERASEIKSLFDRAGEPAFASLFDQAYLPRELCGLRSWIGVADNKAVLHMSVGLERFSDGGISLTAGVLGDLMADPEHRDLWSPIKLVRRAVADVRKDATVDFLLTYYTPAAEAVFRAGGFKPYLTLRRHVFPLVRPYVLLRRLMHRRTLPRLTAVPFSDNAVDAHLLELRSPGAFRPIADRAYFATRMPRVLYPTGTWLLAGDPKTPEAVVLVSPRTPKELVVADVLWRSTKTPLAAIMLAVAGWASRQGHQRLTLTTIESSVLSFAAQHAGFLIRPEKHTVMLLATSSTAVPAPEQWSFTPFVLTSW